MLYEMSLTVCGRVTVFVPLPSPNIAPFRQRLTSFFLTHIVFLVSVGRDNCCSVRCKNGCIYNVFQRLLKIYLPSITGQGI